MKSPAAPSLNSDRSLARRYWFLMACQIIGAGIVLWKGIPFYRRLLLGEPDIGAQLSTAIWALIVVALLQSTFWKVRQLPVAVKCPARPFPGYLIMFLGRITFVYVAGLFAAVFYVRYAELQFAFWREALLLTVIFSMFCFTTELERLGKALLEAGPDGKNSLKDPPSIP